MQKRTLGKGGLDPSVIGYECLGRETSYGPATDRQERVRIIRAAFERLACVDGAKQARG